MPGWQGRVLWGYARMAELVDALVSNTSGSNAVPVRSRLRVLFKQKKPWYKTRSRLFYLHQMKDSWNISVEKAIYVLCDYLNLLKIEIWMSFNWYSQCITAIKNEHIYIVLVGRSFFFSKLLLNIFCFSLDLLKDTYKITSKNFVNSLFIITSV